MPNPKVPPGLKLLRTDEISGTTPAGRKPPTVAKLPRVVPPVPESVRADPVAFAEWRRMTPILQPARLLHEPHDRARGVLPGCKSLPAGARALCPGGGVLPRGARPGPLPPGLGGQFGLAPATDDVPRRRFGLCRTA
jgi:hypothetical protein